MAAIVVHALEDAQAALSAARALGTPLTLISAPAAAGYAGVGWFERAVAQAADTYDEVKVTAILDCGDAAGDVMAAIRWLTEPKRFRLTLCFTGEAETASRLHAMAREAGVELIRERPPAHELRGQRDPVAACRQWLGAP